MLCCNRWRVRPGQETREIPLHATQKARNEPMMRKLTAVSLALLLALTMAVALGEAPAAFSLN